MKKNSRCRMASAWGAFLAQFSWTYYVTLTCKYPKGRERMFREFEAYIRRSEKRVQGKIYWFAVVEKTCAGFYHVHALLLTGKFTQLFRLARWELGRSQVLIYDSRRAATYYITKEMDWGRDYYRFVLPVAD